MVSEGSGVCALPERSVIVDGIVLKPVSGLSLQRNISMVTVSGSGNPREVRQILAMAADFDWSEQARPLKWSVNLRRFAIS